MKALTISQPYASLIATGEKFVENRRWHTDYTGPLLIHAGKGTQYLLPRDLAAYPHGCAIALVDLIGCFSLKEIGKKDRNSTVGGTNLTFASIRNHKHAEGPFCLILRNVRVLSSPIPCAGKQKLWDVSPELAADVERRLIRMGEIALRLTLEEWQELHRWLFALAKDKGSLIANCLARSIYSAALTKIAFAGDVLQERLATSTVGLIVEQMERYEPGHPLLAKLRGATA